MASKRPTSKKKGPPPAAPLDAQYEEAVMDLDVKDQNEFDHLWLVEAIQLVHGDRAQQYGHPHTVYSRALPMWMGILGIPVTYTQLCYCVAALKMARELTTPHPEEDNNRDIAGYIGVLNRIKLRQIELALEDTSEIGSTAESAPGVAGS